MLDDGGEHDPSDERAEPYGCEECPVAPAFPARPRPAHDDDEDSRDDEADAYVAGQHCERTTRRSGVQGPPRLRCDVLVNQKQACKGEDEEERF
jgi:hypothetical protein